MRQDVNFWCLCSEKQSWAAVLISVRIIDHSVWMSDEAAGLWSSPDKKHAFKNKQQQQQQNSPWL